MCTHTLFENGLNMYCPEMSDLGSQGEKKHTVDASVAFVCQEEREAGRLQGTVCKMLEVVLCLLLRVCNVVSVTNQLPPCQHGVKFCSDGLMLVGGSVGGGKKSPRLPLTQARWICSVARLIPRTLIAWALCCGAVRVEPRASGLPADPHSPQGLH